MSKLRILILGGTTFLGPHLVEALLSQGHSVTIFTRGKTNPSLFDASLEKLYGDRNTDMKALENTTWDVVIDTSCSLPRQAKLAASFLQKNVGSYVFISSVGVYENFLKDNIDESFPTGKLGDPTSEEITEKTYGPLKALSEEVILSYFQEQSLIIRPGLIVGPQDPTGRFSYWPRRMIKEGPLLLPNVPNQHVQYIDVRDLSSWIVAMIEKKEKGTYNATGISTTFKEFIEACQKILKSKNELIWVDESFLLENGIQDWVDLPLWLASSRNMLGFLSVSIEKAFKKGLQLRPLENTLSSILDEPSSQNLALSEERERELLHLWKKNAHS